MFASPIPNDQRAPDRFLALRGQGQGHSLWAAGEKPVPAKAGNEFGQGLGLGRDLHATLAKPATQESTACVSAGSSIWDAGLPVQRL